MQYYKWDFPTTWLSLDQAHNLFTRLFLSDLTATDLIARSNILEATPRAIERRVIYNLWVIVQKLSKDANHPSFKKEWGSNKYLEKRRFTGVLPPEYTAAETHAYLSAQALDYAGKAIAKSLATAVFEAGGKFSDPEAQLSFEHKIVELVRRLAPPGGWLAYYLGRGPWCLLARIEDSDS